MRTRRHHNNCGRAQVANGRTQTQMRNIARRLANKTLRKTIMALRPALEQALRDNPRAFVTEAGHPPSNITVTWYTGADTVRALLAAIDDYA